MKNDNKVQKLEILYFIFKITINLYILYFVKFNLTNNIITMKHPYN